MIGYVRKDSTPEVSHVAYNLNAFTSIDAYHDEEKLNPKIGCYGYNIAVKGGNLTGTIGAGAPTYQVGGKSVTLPSLVPQGEYVLKMHHFRCSGLGMGEDKIIVHSHLGNFYYADLLRHSEFKPLEGASQGVSDVTFLNYFSLGRDVLLAYHSKGLTTYDGESTSNYESCPKMTDVTMLYERAFGIEPSTDTLHFSAPLNPTDFSLDMGGGSITIRDDGGKMQRVIAMGNAIYIFKEYAVYRLSVYGSPEDYTLTKVVDTHSEILGKTIALSPSGILLMMDKVLYLFDGYKLKVLERGIFALMESTEHAVGKYFDENYYLACSLVKDDEKVGDEEDFGITYNNGIIHYNPETKGQGVMRGADIVGFYPVLTSEVKEIFVLYGNDRAHRAGKLTSDGALYGVPLKKKWRSPRYNFLDVQHFKILKRAQVDTAYDLNLTVTQGATKVKRRVYGYGRLSRPEVVPFNTSGYDFYLEIEAEGDLNVRGIKLSFDFVRRYFT